MNRQPAPEEECPKCRGDGFIAVPHYAPDDEGSEGVRTCPLCHGKGTIQEEEENYCGVPDSERGKDLGFRRIKCGDKHIRRKLRRTREGTHWVMFLCEPWQVREKPGDRFEAWRRMV